MARVHSLGDRIVVGEHSYKKEGVNFCSQIVVWQHAVFALLFGFAYKERGWQEEWLHIFWRKTGWWLKQEILNVIVEFLSECYQ